MRATARKTFIERPEKFLTAAELARHLKMPDQRVYSLVKAGEVIADAVTSSSFLFLESSISVVEKIMAEVYPNLSLPRR